MAKGKQTGLGDELFGTPLASGTVTLRRMADGRVRGQRDYIR